MTEVVAANQYDSDRVALIKKTLATDATNDELEFFIARCKQTGLEPLAGQIYFVKRKGKMTIQTGIDGLRLVAERSGKYAGQQGPFWCGKDGVWKDVWLTNENPVAAKVAVLRSDFSEPLWAVARWDSYAQFNRDGALTPTWKGLGDVMLAKCAEALALRKAFPQDASGLYTADEMAQAEDNDEETRPTTQRRQEAPKPVAPPASIEERGTVIDANSSDDEPPATTGQINRLTATLKALGHEDDDTQLKAIFEVSTIELESITDLTHDEAADLISVFSELVKKKAAA